MWIERNDVTRRCELRVEPCAEHIFRVGSESRGVARQNLESALLIRQCKVTLSQ